jgi:spermidine synthase
MAIDAFIFSRTHIIYTMQRILIVFLLYFFIFATGVSGLIYQVVWQKYLSRLLGGDNIATAIILATFLGGLSCGYYLCGKLTTRVKQHFKAYALLEGAIALWCFFFPIIFAAVQSLTSSWSFSAPFLIVFQGLFCSVLLMGLPTICMGGTIPILTRGLSKNIRAATHVHATVYAVNTAGAFLGALLASFYLIPVFGLPATLKGSALLNLGAGAFFLILAAQSKRKSSINPDFGHSPLKPVPDDLRLDIPTRFPAIILYLIVFLSGLYVMTLENVLIRITNLSLGSSSYSFALIVSVFILSIATGSYLVGRLKKIRQSFLFLNQLVITLTLLLIYLSLDTWPYFTHLIRTQFTFAPRDFFAFYGNIFATLMLILILPAGLMGATVPLAFHELKQNLSDVGNHAGLLFSLNTAGSLLGSLMGGILLFYFLDNGGVFLSAVLLAALSTLLAAWGSKRLRLASALLPMAILILIVYEPFYSPSNFMVGTFGERKRLTYAFKGPRFFFEQWNKNRTLLYYNDGPAATVAVTRHPHPPIAGNAKNSLAIVINGKSDSSTLGDSYTIKLLAHIPALFLSKISDCMVIGLGTGVTAGELTLYDEIARVDVAEISPSVISALPYFAHFTHNVSKNPKVHIHEGDAFRILGRSRKKWDCIISEPSNPWVTGVDLLFTREFYHLTREHLTADGMLVQWIHTYFSNPDIMGMIIKTVSQEFKYCRVFMATPGDLILVATNKHLRAQDIQRARHVLQRNRAVYDSLKALNLASMESILIREIWPPAYIADRFARYDIQTMDHPRLHYMAGKAFFGHDHIPVRYLFNRSSAPYAHDYLLTLTYPNLLSKRVKDKVVFSRGGYQTLINSLTDRYLGYELPMADALRLRAFLSDPNPFQRTELENSQLMQIKDLESLRNWIIPDAVDDIRRTLYPDHTNP